MSLDKIQTQDESMTQQTHQERIRKPFVNASKFKIFFILLKDQYIVKGAKIKKKVLDVEYNETKLEIYLCFKFKIMTYLTSFSPPLLIKLKINLIQF